MSHSPVEPSAVPAQAPLRQSSEKPEIKAFERTSKDFETLIENVGESGAEEQKRGRRGTVAEEEPEAEKEESDFASSDLGEGTAILNLGSGRTYASSTSFQDTYQDTIVPTTAPSSIQNNPTSSTEELSTTEVQSAQRRKRPSAPTESSEETEARRVRPKEPEKIMAPSSKKTSKKAPLSAAVSLAKTSKKEVAKGKPKETPEVVQAAPPSTKKTPAKKPISESQPPKKVEAPKKEPKTKKAPSTRKKIEKKEAPEEGLATARKIKKSSEAKALKEKQQEEPISLPLSPPTLASLAYLAQATLHHVTDVQASKGSGKVPPLAGRPLPMSPLNALHPLSDAKEPTMTLTQSAAKQRVLEALKQSLVLFEETKDRRSLTITLRDPRLQGTPFERLTIRIEEYSSAPRQFNLFLEGSSAAQNLLTPMVQEMLGALNQIGKERGYTIQRLEVLAERPLFHRKGETSGKDFGGHGGKNPR